MGQAVIAKLVDRTGAQVALASNVALEDGHLPDALVWEGRTFKFTHTREIDGDVETPVYREFVTREVK